MITPVDDALTYIRRHPRMFLRAEGVSGAELASNLINDALLLTRGRITGFRYDAWWIVISDVDWITSEGEDQEQKVFTQIVPMPAAGPNSMRSEVLLAAFARDVVTASTTSRYVIKGEIPVNEDIWNILNANQGWKRAIAFRLPMAANGSP